MIDEDYPYPPVSRGNVTVEEVDGRLVEVWRDGKDTVCKTVPPDWLRRHYRPVEQVIEEAAQLKTIPLFEDDRKPPRLSIFVQGAHGGIRRHYVMKNARRAQTDWTFKDARKIGMKLLDEDETRRIHYLNLKDLNDPGFSSYREIEQQKGNNMNIDNFDANGLTVDQIAAIRGKLDAAETAAKDRDDVRTGITDLLGDKYTLEQIFPEKFKSAAPSSAGSKKSASEKAKGQKLTPEATYKDPVSGKEYTAKPGQRPTWVREFLDRGELPPLA